MKKKILFFDIDGTIMGTGKFIPESAKLAIKLARQKGNLCFVCSGRSKAMIPAEIHTLGFDGYICAGGTHVIIGEEEIVDIRLSPSQIRTIIQWFKSSDLGLFLEGKEHIYRLPYESYSDVTSLKIFLKELTAPQKEIKADRLHEVNVSKFSGMVSPVQWEHALKMADAIKDFMTPIIHRAPDALLYRKALEENTMHLSPENTLDASGYGFLEFLPNGYNKATGIRTVLSKLSIPFEDAYGFGDSENDREMLSILKNSVCMGNGSESIKKIASYITAPLTEDGLYKAMSHFALI